MFSILKFGILANARVLAIREGEHYVILLSLLDHASAESVRANLKRQPNEEIEETEVPALRGVGFAPWGQILSGRISERCVEMLSMDADLVEALDRDTAKRMDEHPGARVATKVQLCSVNLEIEILLVRFALRPENLRCVKDRFSAIDHP